MDKTIKLDVTRDDIRNGRKGDATSCPIALSLKRYTGALGAGVYEDGMNWTMPSGIQYEVKTSMKALRFIRAFDDGWSVQPCSFTLKPIKPRCSNKTRKSREK